jgi:hypothetical protein
MCRQWCSGVIQVDIVGMIERNGHIIEEYNNEDSFGYTFDRLY